MITRKSDGKSQADLRDEHDCIEKQFGEAAARQFWIDNVMTYDFDCPDEDDRISKEEFEKAGSEEPWSKLAYSRGYCPLIGKSTRWVRPTNKTEMVDGKKRSFFRCSREFDPRNEVDKELAAKELLEEVYEPNRCQ